jgi:hypothetical protein
VTFQPARLQLAACCGRRDRREFTESAPTSRLGILPSADSPRPALPAPSRAERSFQAVNIGPCELDHAVLCPPTNNVGCSRLPTIRKPVACQKLSCAQYQFNPPQNPPANIIGGTSCPPWALPVKPGTLAAALRLWACSPSGTVVNSCRTPRLVTLHNVVTVSQERLGNRVTSLSELRMPQVCAALRLSLGCV